MVCDGESASCPEVEPLGVQRLRRKAWGLTARGRKRSALVAAPSAALLLLLVPAAAAASDRQRGWEMVSPPVKYGMDAVALQSPVLSGPDGSGIGFSTTGGFAGTVNGGSNSYIARRGTSSWMTQAITPPLLIERPDPVSSALAVYFASDMSRALLAQGTSAVFPGGPEGERRALFLRDATDGSLTWITQPTTASPVGDPDYSLAGASPRLEHIVFDARPVDANAGTVRLVDGDQQRMRGGGLYDYVDGALTPVGVLPDGSVPADGATAPRQWATEMSADNQVSRDGRSIVFVSPDPAVTSNPAPRQLYLRIDGRTTQLVSRSMLTGAESPASATFELASPTGRKVWFRTSARLTTDAPTLPPAGVNRYVFDSQADTVEYLPDDVGSPLVSSDDGGRFLYVKTGGADELWISDDGARTRIAAPVETELSVFVDGKAVRSTRSGSRFLFMTENQINPGMFNNTSGTKQVYLYDTESRELSCVSCPADPNVQARPASFISGNPAGIPGNVQAGRAMSSDGRRVVFETATPLADRDVNGKRDVYLWEDGEITLISAGTGPFDSRVGDISEDASDIFFMTRDRLVPADVDGSVDIYDARVGGGFPEAPPAPGCDLECAGPATPPPSIPYPKTAGDGGRGNVEEPPTARAQVFMSRVTETAARSFARTGRLRITARTTTRGTVSAVAYARTGRRWYVAGRTSRALRSAGTEVLMLGLSGRARKQLSRAHVLRLRIVVGHSAGDGTRQQTIVLRTSRASASRAGAQRIGARSDA